MLYIVCRLGLLVGLQMAGGWGSSCVSLRYYGARDKEGKGKEEKRREEERRGQEVTPRSNEGRVKDG